MSEEKVETVEPPSNDSVPIDNSTKSTVQKIPLLSIRAGPRDKDQWVARLKQELKSLIQVRCCLHLCREATLLPLLSFCLQVSFTSLDLPLPPQFVQYNKKNDNDWFLIEPNKTGTRWTGKCWHIHNLVKYEFKLEFEVRFFSFVFVFLFFSFLFFFGGFTCFAWLFVCVAWGSMNGRLLLCSLETRVVCTLTVYCSYILSFHTALDSCFIPHHSV